MFIDTLILSNEEWNNQDEILLAFVSKERKERILRYRFEIDRKLSLYSALIVSMRAMQQLGVSNTEIQIEIREDGKPILAEHSEFHFNISHTRSAVLCGFSNEEIGVDVEKINKAPFDIMKKCYTPNEIALVDIKVEENENFYKIWTRKEAYGKWNGRGITQDLLSLNTLEPKDKIAFETWREEDYIFTVCEAGDHVDCIKRKLTEDMIFDFFQQATE